MRPTFGAACACNAGGPLKPDFGLSGDVHAIVGRPDGIA